MRSCALCGDKVNINRHKDGGKFCSKHCELEFNKLEEITELEFIQEGFNALGFKDLVTRGRFYARTIVIGDSHHPFSNQKLLKKIYAFIKDFKPKFVVQVGDLYDYFSQGKYPRTHRLMTPEQEVMEGRDYAVEMWAHINKAHAASKKVQLRGNHDARPYKRLLEKCPELEPFFKIDHLFKFNKVETVLDEKQEVVLGGVLYQHGYKKHGDHMKVSLMPTVHGHTHKAGIIYQMLRNQLIWEMDAGLVADLDSIPLGYGSTKWKHCTSGLGVIDEYGPRFIHEEQL
jgi:predicted phosphodiesterase